MKSIRILFNSFIMIVIALSVLGFTWGKEAKSKKEKVKTQAQTSSETQISDVSKRRVVVEKQRVGEEGSEDSMSYVPESKKAQSTGISREIISETKIPKIPSQIDIPSKLPRLPSARLPDLPHQQIIDIQRQINEITSINETLKSRYTSHAEEIQRINDQAIIHSRILKEIQQSRDERSQYTQDDAKLILQQEKIRMIEEETERKRQFLKELENEEEEPALVNLTKPETATLKKK